MDNAEYFALQEEFLAIAKENLAPDDDYVFADVIDEARYHVSDWYNNCSHYAKPEDILVDFFMLTPEQAHKYLILFRDRS